ncbi:hypothetical protein [Pseudobutyrivibrio sp. YE44]|uniref:hypothetical protein n=1 Tax=Pseudobutyrivibrio sp. YE44 TaxID=1520802 RepID=UPI00115FE8E5|nr:hypothetical protein [Pseudobutyrivibrio sp. YE44]
MIVSCGKEASDTEDAEYVKNEAVESDETANRDELVEYTYNENESDIVNLSDEDFNPDDYTNIDEYKDYVENRLTGAVEEFEEVNECNVYVDVDDDFTISHATVEYTIPEDLDMSEQEITELEAKISEYIASSLKIDISNIGYFRLF